MKQFNIDFNVNEYVQVRLTDVGREALRRSYMNEMPEAVRARYPYQKPVEDAEGWSRWQLWHLMRELGHLCRLGDAPPFDTVIRIEQQLTR